MNIKEILKLENDKKIEGVYIVDTMRKVPFKDKDKGEFLAFKLFDRTGTVDAKIWKNTDEVFDKVKNGDVVKIIGASNIYRDKMSVIVMKIDVDEDYDIAKLLPASKYNPKTMFKDVCEIMDTIKDEDIMKLWIEIKNDDSFIKKFMRCPGGKGKTHHAYLHGLLEHTLSILIILKRFAIIPEADVDKMYMGGFLHDVGKIYSYKWDSNIEMTNLGRLHEHTALGYSFFMIRMSDIDMPHKKRVEIIEDIGHIILSHHDIPEFHTFVRPMTLEAKLVAQADFFDSFQTRHRATFEDLDEEWFYSNLDNQFFFKRK